MRRSVLELSKINSRTVASREWNGAGFWGGAVTSYGSERALKLSHAAASTAESEQIKGLLAFFRCPMASHATSNDLNSFRRLKSLRHVAKKL